MEKNYTRGDIFMKGRRKGLSLILALALVIALMPVMSLRVFAIEPDNTNYDLKAVSVSAQMPGVYTVQAALSSDENNPKTIGIPSIAKQNLVDKATKELPAIIMGAAVNYEKRTGPTEFTPIAGAELVAPYSYFRWGVMDEQRKEADGSTTTHKKLSGFDGSYYIVRVDVSALIEEAKTKNNGSLDGKYLHVRQQNNKALLVATGMTDSSYVYADPAATNNKGGCKAAVYPLDDNAAAMKDTTGNDREKPYLDVILVSSSKNIAGADAGGADAPVPDVDLAFYVEGTKDYKPWMKALDPNNMPTFPYTIKDNNGTDVTFPDEAAYNTALTTKFFDQKNATSENTASFYKVMGSDLEIDVAVDNNQEGALAGGTGAGKQQYRSIDWLKEKMDFWSMEKAIAHEEYDNHTIILICEAPVLDSMKISGKGERSVILDVNSFDIQIANNTAKGEAGLTIGNNATLRIKDSSNTAGAELAIGNNATMVVESGGIMVIDETCTVEAEFDAASTTGNPSQTTPTEYLSGEITVKEGGWLVNYGVINIEGTEGKPLDPAQPVQPGQQRDKMNAEILVESGGTLSNYGCLSIKGALGILGTLNNFGRYNDILRAYDPDQNIVDYHRGIQITWKDDITQDGVQPGVLHVGVDGKGNINPEAELNNYGDIIIAPGTFTLHGVFNNYSSEDSKIATGEEYAGHMYLCTVTEAIIPIVNPNDPLVVEKKITASESNGKLPRESAFLNNGTVNNKGEIDGGAVALVHNGRLGELSPIINASNKEVALSEEGIALPVDQMFTFQDGVGEASYSVEGVTGEGSYDEAQNRLKVTKCGTFLVTVRTAATDKVRATTAIAALTVRDENVKPVDMHRLYNPNSGEHFYTGDVEEKDRLVGLGWNYEGVAWNAPEKSSVPVYRLYNPNAGDHHYTKDAAERDHLIEAGWNDEGIGWYSAETEDISIFRLYNPNALFAGAHHYTADADERDQLVEVGWRDEKIGWYGLDPRSA